MIETTQATGDKGLLIVDDNTDGPNKTVDLYISSSTTIRVPQLPWAYSVDGVMSNWQSFNFTDTLLRQHLGLIYVGYATEFILHLGNTGTSALGGPTDFTVTLTGGVQTVNIKVGDVYKKAIPYINVNGVWSPASPWVMDQGQWKQSS